MKVRHIHIVLTGESQLPLSCNNFGSKICAFLIHKCVAHFKAKGYMLYSVHSSEVADVTRKSGNPMSHYESFEKVVGALYVL